MKKLLLIAFVALLHFKYTAAQEQLSIKQQADKLYERYDYFKSLKLYLKLVNNKTNVQVLEDIAACYRNLNRYEEAETWYGKAVADAKASRVSHYFYAEVLLRDKKFEQAKAQYKLYFTTDLATLKLKLATCDSAAAWIKQKPAYIVKNEENLNTEFSDWGLNYEGKTALVFTSDRKTDGQGVDDRTGNNFFKLYEEVPESKDITEVTLATNYNSIFNDKYHIGPIAFNNAADTAYITITTAVSSNKINIDASASKNDQRLYTRRLQLVMAVKRNGKWTVFGNFAYNNIQQYSIGDAALSKDGKVIYFTSDMPGGVGKTDIWYCEKQPDGKWGKPVNCGNTINTKQEEAFPYIGGDGNLYYSSRGLPGMGGYDIYKTKGEKLTWSTPKNIRYPINSTSDDFYLVTNDGISGYFSSNREGGKGNDDIYSFAFKPVDSVPAKPVAKTTAKPGLTAQQIPQLLAGAGIVPIYYDLDKSNIRPDAALILDKLAALLKQYPALTIELSSYTDSRASEDYNMALSQRRAKAVVDYLTEKGIAPSRLTAKFYGENNLVNKCADNVPCSEAEHQLNRRTEFKALAGGN